jgi:hypothetical protein
MRPSATGRGSASSRPPALALVVVALATVLAGCAPSPLVTLPGGDWVVAAQGPTVRYLVRPTHEPPADPAAALARLEAFLADVGPAWYVPDELHYYAFPDCETLRDETGWTITGRAILYRDAVVSCYASDAHEVAHVLTAPRDRPLRLANFWLEGIAMYYTWPEVYLGEDGVGDRPRRVGNWQGASVHAWALAALRNGELVPLERLVHGNAAWGELDDGVSYPLAGSFVTHLLGPGHRDLRRIAALRAFYDAANAAADRQAVLAAFERHFGHSLADAEAAWLAFLAAHDEASR